MAPISTAVKPVKTNGSATKNKNGTQTMKALVYHGPGKKSWEERPKPVLLEPADAVVRILKTTICGTDLHIMKGDLPEVEGRKNYRP